MEQFKEHHHYRSFGVKSIATLEKTPRCMSYINHLHYFKIKTRAQSHARTHIKAQKVSYCFQLIVKVLALRCCLSRPHFLI